MNISTLKKPSAFLPIAMSFAALAVVLVHVIRFGAAREADEGTAAHIWQILMAAQAPLVAFFIIKWLPRTPKQALTELLRRVIYCMIEILFTAKGSNSELEKWVSARW